MKFGREFASQMVQEWKEAHMDYSLLKAVLKDIIRFRQKNTTPRGSLRRNVSLYRTFSGLTKLYRNSSMKKEDEVEVIHVNAIPQEGSEEKYQTMFLMSSDVGGEYELVFFRRLDDEFNKVVKFYRKKVKEVMEEAEELSRQMNVLIALRVKVENPVVKFAESNVINLARNGISSSSSVVHPEIPEIEMSSEAQTEKEESRDKKGIQGFRPASLEILDHVKINVTPETLLSTLRGIMSSISDSSFSKERLRNAEELMIRAFIEFYQKLRLLKSYCFMNQLAFSKIMKKYDKITSRNASKAYLEMVDASYLGSSDEVNYISPSIL